MKLSVILAHGFLGSSLNWGPVLNRLKSFSDFRDVEFFVPDLLGHGKRAGETLPSPLHLKDVALDLKNQLPHLGPWIGVGHSFGLRPLLYLSAENPNLFSKIVAEDSSPVLSGPGLQQLFDIFEKIPVPFVSRDEAKGFLDLRYGQQTALSKFLLSNIRETNEGYTWRFQRSSLRELLIDCRDHELWSQWAAFQGPMHMILGDRSDYVSQERLNLCELSRKGKITTREKISNAGHWVHSDQPEAFSVALRRALLTS